MTFPWPERNASCSSAGKLRAAGGGKNRIRYDGNVSAQDEKDDDGITQEAKNTAAQYASELSVLQQHWGWLDDVKDTAIRMRNSMEQNPADKRREILPEIYGPALRRAKRFLDYFHAAHLGKPQPSPIDTVPPEIYACFVHDLQTVEKGAGISQDFFVIRSVEIPKA